MRVPRTPSMVAATLLALPLTTFAPATSYAAGETCDGKPATIVISSEPDAAEFGTAGDDVVVVTTSDVFTFDGLGGNDTICGGPGTNTIYGDTGNDAIFLDAVTPYAAADGGPGDDTIVGSPLTDFIVGGPGDDTLTGGAGDDEVFGGSGDDHVSGSAGNDEVSGGFSQNLLADIFPQEEEEATPGIDVVDGGPGDDVVHDGASDDTLVGGAGSDELALGDDYDDPEACGAAGNYKPVLSVADHSVKGLGTDTFRGFESFHGGPYREVFMGSKGPDHFEDSYCGRTRMFGEHGDDTLVSHSCRAQVIAGPGADTVIFDKDGTGVYQGDQGDDQMVMTESDGYVCGSRHRVRGGPGSDWLVVSAIISNGLQRVDLHRGIAGQPGYLQSHLRDIENVRQLDDPRFGAGPLRIVGTDGPNILVGGNGPTLIFGRGGDDVLRGGHGRDTIYGGTGHDSCRAEVRHECEAR